MNSQKVVSGQRQRGTVWVPTSMTSKSSDSTPVSEQLASTPVPSEKLSEKDNASHKTPSISSDQGISPEQEHSASRFVPEGKFSEQPSTTIQR